MSTTSHLIRSVWIWLSASQPYVQYLPDTDSEPGWLIIEPQSEPGWQTIRPGSVRARCRWPARSEHEFECYALFRIWLADHEILHSLELNCVGV